MKEKTEDSVNTSFSEDSPYQHRFFLFDHPDNIPWNKLHRGDGRPPDTIFDQGFKAKGTNPDLVTHTVPPQNADSFHDSGYVSTSRTKEVAYTFPKNLRGNLGYVYEIHTPKTGIDIEKVLPSLLKKQGIPPEDVIHYQAEHEIAFPEKVKSSYIKGAWPIERFLIANHPDIETHPGVVRINEETVGVLGKYISNPHFDPSDFLLARTLKGVGRVASAAGVVLDGARLTSAFKEAKRTGDNGIFFEESARITGGWTGAIAGGKILSTAGAAAGGAFGIPGSIVGGFAGGVIGSVGGYLGGSVTGETIYEGVKKMKTKLESIPAKDNDSYVHDFQQRVASEKPLLNHWIRSAMGVSSSFLIYKSQLSDKLLTHLEASLNKESNTKNLFAAKNNELSLLLYASKQYGQFFLPRAWEKIEEKREFIHKTLAKQPKKALELTEKNEELLLLSTQWRANQKTLSALFQSSVTQAKTIDDFIAKANVQFAQLNAADKAILKGINALSEYQSKEKLESQIAAAKQYEKGQKMQVIQAWSDASNSAYNLGRIAHSLGNKELGKAFQITGACLQGIAAIQSMTTVTGLAVLGPMAALTGGLAVMGQSFFGNDEGSGALEAISWQIEALRKEVQEIKGQIKEFEYNLNSRLTVFFNAVEYRLNHVLLQQSFHSELTQAGLETILTYMQRNLLAQADEAALHLEELPKVKFYELVPQVFNLIALSTEDYTSGKAICTAQQQSASLTIEIADRGKLFAYIAACILQQDTTLINPYLFQAAVSRYVTLRTAPQTYQMDVDLRQLDEAIQYGETFLTFIHKFQQNQTIIENLLNQSLNIIGNLSKWLSLQNKVRHFLLTYEELRKVSYDDIPVKEEAILKICSAKSALFDASFHFKGNTIEERNLNFQADHKAIDKKIVSSIIEPSHYNLANLFSWREMLFQHSAQLKILFSAFQLPPEIVKSLSYVQFPNLEVLVEQIRTEMNALSLLSSDAILFSSAITLPAQFLNYNDIIERLNQFSTALLQLKESSKKYFETSQAKVELVEQAVVKHSLTKLYDLRSDLLQWQAQVFNLTSPSNSKAISPEKLSEMQEMKTIVVAQTAKIEALESIIVAQTAKFESLESMMNVLLETLSNKEKKQEHSYFPQGAGASSLSSENWPCQPYNERILVCFNNAINPDKTRIVHKLPSVTRQWSNLTSDNYASCNSLENTGITHCRGQYTEFLEAELTRPSLCTSLVKSATHSALASFTPEFIGDLLEMSKYASKAQAKQIKEGINILMMGLWFVYSAETYLELGVSLFFCMMFSNLTQKLFKMFGASDQNARMAGNAASFFVGSSKHLTTQEGLLTTAVHLVAGQVGLFAEKKTIHFLKNAKGSKTPQFGDEVEEIRKSVMCFGVIFS